MSKRFIFSSIFAVSALFAVSMIASRAYAQTSPSLQPNIQTYSTATSSTVIIASPAGYKSEVISTYDGNQFHTYATSTPLTAQDEQAIQANIQAEQTEMQQFFQQEQALLNEQEQMFRNMWNGYI